LFSFTGNIRFGDGYTVTVRLSGERPDVSLLQQFMANTFSNAQLREHHQNVLHYQLPTTNTTLAKIFSHMEHARALFDIEDYAVSQTTLDQVQLTAFLLCLVTYCQTQSSRVVLFLF